MAEALAAAVELDEPDAEEVVVEVALALVDSLPVDDCAGEPEGVDDGELEVEADAVGLSDGGGLADADAVADSELDAVADPLPAAVLLGEPDCEGDTLTLALLLAVELEVVVV